MADKEWRNIEEGLPSETKDTWVCDNAGRIFVARFMSPWGEWFTKYFPTTKVHVVRWRNV